MSTYSGKLALSAAFSILVLCGRLPAQAELIVPPNEVYMYAGWTWGSEIMQEPGKLPFYEKITHPPYGVVESFVADVSVKLAIPTIEFNGSALNVSCLYGGGATVGGSLVYYFGFENPYNVTNIQIPITFASKVKVLAKNYDPVTDFSKAYASLRIGEYDPTTGKHVYDGKYLFGIYAFALTGNTSMVRKTDLWIAAHQYELGDIGWVRMSASGSTSLIPDTNLTSGFFSAYIDPVIQVDPTFMVEVDGQMIPGSEAFPIVFSEGIMQVPEPSTVMLALVACLVLLTLRRVRPSR